MLSPEHESVGNRFRGTWLDWVPIPVPADYVIGIDLQRKDFEDGLPSYLAGEIRHRGWWYYYLYALAVKEPIGLMGLAVWGIVLPYLGLSGRWNRTDEVLLVLPAAAILVLVSSQTGITNYMRYVLPLFPFVIVSTSKLAYYCCRETFGLGLVVIGLLAWSIAASIAIHPHQLSYFNETAGGPENGHNHLVESNIDWGQDLLFLKEWIDHHPEATAGAGLFHLPFRPPVRRNRLSSSPIGAQRLVSGRHGNQQRLGPHPGWYAISVNYLRDSGSELRMVQGLAQDPVARL